MQSHPLNQAHQQHRRAEAHLRYKRFDDAALCHQNAAELLFDAMKSTSSSHALESITLQHSYHLKQKDLIKYKKDQFDRAKKAMDNLKYLSRDPVAHFPEQQESKLQVAIYRAIQENDSLLAILLHPDDEGSSKTVKKPVDVVSNDECDGTKAAINKKIKSQQTVIEELQILSQNLHSLVDKLVVQVEIYKDENATLKERISYLENERVKYLNMHAQSAPHNNFQVVTDSGSDYMADMNLQFTLASPVTLLAGRMAANNDTHSKPVQKPNFDLSAFRNE